MSAIIDVVPQKRIDLPDLVAIRDAIEELRKRGSPTSLPTSVASTTSRGCGRR